MAYTAEETKDSTDAEREALAFDDSNITDADVVDASAAAAPPAVAVADPVAAAVKPDGAAADAAAVAAPDAAAAPAVAAPAAEPPAAAAPEPAVTVTPVADQAPSLLVIQAPADAPEKLAKIATDKDALAAEFDAGDITGAEFQRRLDALNKDERAIETLVNNANLTAQLEQNRKHQIWGAQCDAFMGSEAGKPYAADQALLDQFDATVKAVGNMPQYRKFTGDQILLKAHQIMQMDQGIATPPGSTPPAADKGLPKPREPLPPTLQNVPTADVTDTGAGQYAHMDRMAVNDPAGYETALANMPAAQRDAYMRA